MPDTVARRSLVPHDRPEFGDLPSDLFSALAALGRVIENDIEAWR
jgi:hypothetical protein